MPDLPAWPSGNGVLLDRLDDADVPAIVRACNDPEIQRWLPLPSP